MRIASMILCCSIVWIHPLLSQSHVNKDTVSTNISPQDSSIICLPCNVLSESPNLKLALQRLHRVRQNNQLSKNAGTADTLFTIIQIGDSHIQGDYFSGEIRKQLHTLYGNAGQGILFPYTLAKSFGPRGTVAKPIGVWIGFKTLSSDLKAPLGLIGYSATTTAPNSSLQVSFNDKFNEPEFQRMSIWHSTDSLSYLPKLSVPFHMVENQSYPSGWGISTYQAAKPASQFELTLSKTRASQDHFNFYGFELIPKRRRGIVYHHCGVVGAQFTHLIDKAPWTIEQIQHLKPDIIIFSFGTNEAYNASLDTMAYIQQMQTFLRKLRASCPQTAIILTTAPDTRSGNLIPPMQCAINNQLKTLAASEKLSIYDLNAVMGGWGSLHTWYKNHLTKPDKLHFTPAGYALQGQLFTLSLMQAYNQENIQAPLDYSDLNTAVMTSVKSLVRDIGDQVTGASTVGETLADTTKVTQASGANKKTNDAGAVKPSPNKLDKEKIHIVKAGENLYRIAKRYHVSYEAIAKRNHMKNSAAIQPGQKLVIPKP